MCRQQGRALRALLLAFLCCIAFASSADPTNVLAPSVAPISSSPSMKDVPPQTIPASGTSTPTSTSTTTPTPTTTTATASPSSKDAPSQKPSSVPAAAAAPKIVCVPSEWTVQSRGSWSTWLTGEIHGITHYLSNSSHTLIKHVLFFTPHNVSVTVFKSWQQDIGMLSTLVHQTFNGSSTCETHVVEKGAPNPAYCVDMASWTRGDDVLLGSGKFENWTVPLHPSPSHGPGFLSIVLQMDQGSVIPTFHNLFSLDGSYTVDFLLFNNSLSVDHSQFSSPSKEECAKLKPRVPAPPPSSTVSPAIPISSANSTSQKPADSNAKPAGQNGAANNNTKGPDAHRFRSTSLRCPFAASMFL